MPAAQLGHEDHQHSRGIRPSQHSVPLELSLSAEACPAASPSGLDSFDPFPRGGDISCSRGTEVVARAVDKLDACPVNMEPLWDPIQVIHEDEHSRGPEAIPHVMSRDAAEQWLRCDPERRCPLCRGQIVRLAHETAAVTALRERRGRYIEALARQDYEAGDTLAHKAVKLLDHQLLRAMCRSLPFNEVASMLVQTNQAGHTPFELLSLLHSPDETQGFLQAFETNGLLVVRSVKSEPHAGSIYFINGRPWHVGTRLSIAGSQYKFVGVVFTTSATIPPDSADALSLNKDLETRVGVAVLLHEKTSRSSNTPMLITCPLCDLHPEIIFEPCINVKHAGQDQVYTGRVAAGRGIWVGGIKHFDDFVLDGAPGAAALLVFDPQVLKWFLFPGNSSISWRGICSSLDQCPSNIEDVGTQIAPDSQSFFKINPGSSSWMSLEPMFRQRRLKGDAKLGMPSTAATPSEAKQMRERLVLVKARCEARLPGSVPTIIDHLGAVISSFSIGRGKGCNLCIPTLTGMSRSHCMLELREVSEVESQVGEQCSENDLQVVSADASGLTPGSMVAIFRSDGSWKYARLIQKTNTVMKFEVDAVGSTKEIRRDAWVDEVKALRPRAESCAQNSSALKEDVCTGMSQTDMVGMDVLESTHAECPEPLCHERKVRHAKQVAKESVTALAWKVIASMSSKLSKEVEKMQKRNAKQIAKKSLRALTWKVIANLSSKLAEEVANMQKGTRGTNTSQSLLQLVAYDDGSLVGTTLNGVPLGVDASLALPVRTGDLLRFGSIEVRMERVSSVLRLDDPKGLSDFYMTIGDEHSRRVSRTLTEISSCPLTMERERQSGFPSISATVSGSLRTFTSHVDDELDAALGLVPRSAPPMPAVRGPQPQGPPRIPAALRARMPSPPTCPIPRPIPPLVSVSPARQEAVAEPTSPREQEQAVPQEFSQVSDVAVVGLFEPDHAASPRIPPEVPIAGPSDALQSASSAPQTFYTFHSLHTFRPGQRIPSEVPIAGPSVADQSASSSPQGTEPDHPANGIPMSREPPLPNRIPARRRWPDANTRQPGGTSVRQEVAVTSASDQGHASRLGFHQVLQQVPTVPRSVPVVGLQSVPLGPPTHGPPPSRAVHVTRAFEMNRCPTLRATP